MNVQSLLDFLPQNYYVNMNNNTVVIANASSSNKTSNIYSTMKTVVVHSQEEEQQQQEQNPITLSAIREDDDNERLYGSEQQYALQTHDDVMNNNVLVTYNTAQTDVSSGSSGSKRSSSIQNGTVDNDDGDISDTFSTISNSMVPATPAVDSHDTTNSRMRSFHSFYWWQQKNAIQKLVSYLERDINAVISESQFLNIQNNTDDSIPQFHRSEIIIGKRLGRGGFADVYEITAFQLNDELSQKLSHNQQELRLRMAAQQQNGVNKYVIKQLQQHLITGSMYEFQLAAFDLAVEVMYLSKLHHPNVLAVRGKPYNGINAFLDIDNIDNDNGQWYTSYFMVCDQLEETLHDRMYKVSSYKAASNNDDSMSILVEKTNYAYQLANALEYLHQYHIVFRDLKPQNIGFKRKTKTISSTMSITDAVSGTAAPGSPSNDLYDELILFDFGLIRELPLHESMDDELYRMSGVGTRRYMAPEVVNDTGYNVKADVYGWSMIYWEMLMQKKPYHFYSLEQHQYYVCECGERPTIPYTKWPMTIQRLLQQSWSHSVHERLNMKDVCAALKCILHEFQQQPGQIADDEKPMNTEGRHLLEEIVYTDTPPSPRGVIDDDASFVVHSSSHKPYRSPFLCFQDFLLSTLDCGLPASASSLTPPRPQLPSPFAVLLPSLSECRSDQSDLVVDDDVYNINNNNNITSARLWSGQCPCLPLHDGVASTVEHNGGLEVHLVPPNEKTLHTIVEDDD